MIECPFCHRDNVNWDRFNRILSCWLCGVVLPADWQECSELYHTTQPSEKPHRDYDPYEDVFRDHAPRCVCITCINLKGWVDYKGGPLSFESTQREYHGVADPDNPGYDDDDS